MVNQGRMTQHSQSQAWEFHGAFREASVRADDEPKVSSLRPSFLALVFVGLGRLTRLNGRRLTAHVTDQLATQD